MAAGTVYSFNVVDVYVESTIIDGEPKVTMHNRPMYS